MSRRERMRAILRIVRSASPSLALAAGRSALVFVLQSALVLRKGAPDASSTPWRPPPAAAWKSPRFRFDWKQMRAEVRGFVLHGSEAAGKPPLFRAGSRGGGPQAGLHSAPRCGHSVSHRVSEPRVYLIIGADGSTNRPRAQSRSTPARFAGRGYSETRHRPLHAGARHLRSRGEEPHPLRGARREPESEPGLRARRSALSRHARHSTAPPQLRRLRPGSVHRQPGLTHGEEPHRARFRETGHRRHAGGRVRRAGRPGGAARRLPVSRPASRWPTSRASSASRNCAPARRGRRQRRSGRRPRASSLTATLHATGVEYRDDSVRLVDFRADGAATAGVKGVDASGMRIAGFYAYEERREAGGGPRRKLRAAPQDIDLNGVALTLLNGSFRGAARVAPLDHYTVTGEMSGIDAPAHDRHVQRRAAAVGRAGLRSGAPGRLAETSQSSLRATGHLRLAPAASGDAVSGEINATYVARKTVRWTWAAPPSRCRTRASTFRERSTAS